jgi:ABC-type Fe3+ transport system permease subunit
MPASDPGLPVRQIAGVSAGSSCLRCSCRSCWVALTLGVPFVTLARWLYLGGLDVWRLDTVGNAFAADHRAGVAGGILATMAAAPMAWLSVRAPGRFQRILEACHYYVGSLPGVVVALALVTITVRLVLPLYQTFATLLVAYILLFLPRAMVGLRASIAQAPVELERAAMGSGARRRRLCGRSPCGLLHPAPLPVLRLWRSASPTS